MKASVFQQSATALETVQARGLFKRYNANFALRDVCLELSAKQAYAFVGDNGSGKTTLLRILAQLSKPSKGQITYLAGTRALHSDVLRRQIGYLSHALGLYERLSCLENLKFFSKIYRAPIAGKHFDALCAQLNVEAFLGKPVGELSRGQAQRVALLRVFAFQPSLILLDEPDTGLDATARGGLVAAVAAARARGAIVVTVSHASKLISQVADTVFTLKAGRLVSDSTGEAEDV